MDTDGPGECVLETLPDGECLRLMASAPVGRIVYTRRAMPAVEPVNFALDQGHIVIRTHPGGKLAAAIGHAVVAFEADEFDLTTHTGWSVTIVGTAQEVTDPAEIARLEDIGLATWAPGEHKHFVRIKPGIITGRRLRGVGYAHHQPKPVR
jgi:nitroimidazol reductase NimA-like FMN-containing flavoprotein (pyridoxamine 5'-phosphate oxidase superfamily)